MLFFSNFELVIYNIYVGVHIYTVVGTITENR